VTTIVAERIHGHPGCDALTFTGGRITAIGPSTDLPAHGAVRVGGVVLPGLRDSHLHPVGIMSSEDQVDLSAVRSLDEVRSLLSEAAARLASGVPLVATALDDDRLDLCRMPTAAELDVAVSDRPVLVYRRCSHVAAANSVALRLAGIGSDVVDPPGGHFRRSADGSATGVVEESAITPIAGALRSADAPADPDRLGALLGRLRKRGVVAIDAMVAVGPSMWCTGIDELGSVVSLGESSPVRVDVHVITQDVAALERAARTLTDAGPRVRFAGWKGFADGSLGGRTAALREPYADQPSTRGMLTASRLDRLAEASIRLGGTAAVHAIGDRAVQTALELADRLGPGRVRIEHASVADPDQVVHMAEAGVIASVQPSFASSDRDVLEPRLGAARAAWAYPFRSMLDAGVVVRAGSDAPIEVPDPFVGIADAVRSRPEAVDIDEAIDLYADRPLAIGGPATFVVVSDDPASLDPEAIREIEVDQVWMEGVMTN
jgi:predicted amidohydrolase YtcJ